MVLYILADMTRK